MRKPVTKVVTRKQGYAVIRYGRVQFRHDNLEAVEDFLTTFDPELARRRADAKSGKSEARLQWLLSQAD